MSIDRTAGALLVGLPIAFNLFFFLLGRSFDYPGVLRSPVGTILSRFHAGGLRLKLLWYGFMLTAVLLAPLAVLLGQVLARVYEDPNSSQATREATAVVFDSFHRYLGVAVGECLGYLLTGTWTLLIAVAMLGSSSFADWLAWPGIAIGASLALGSLEFVGRFEEHGWKLAGTIVPIAYTAWSLWLLAAGIVLLV